MRKYYVAVGADAGHSDDTAFGADYWKKVWRSVGGTTGAVDKVVRTEDYPHMRRFIERLPKGARLLDGGCGLGEWTAFFSGLAYPTLGLDNSAETVGQLRTVFHEQRFEVGDIRAAGLPDAGFDGYFSWGTFEHCEEGVDPCLLEAWRLLKPGGYLFITTPFDNLRHASAAAFDRRRADCPAAGQRRSYQWRLTRGEMRGYHTNNGFEVLDLVPIAKRQGIVRILWQWFGLHYDKKATKARGYGLAPFAWSDLVAHMLMGIARKPGP